MKISVLESIPFSTNQRSRLSRLGCVDYYDCIDKISKKILRTIKDSDVIILSRIDPSPYLYLLKPNSLVSLLSTEYGRIKNTEEARARNILLSYIPKEYAPERTAEYIFGLLLAYAKKIVQCSNWSRPVTEPIILSFQSRSNIIPAYAPPKQSIELNSKVFGIIGLGSVGSYMANYAGAFGMQVITYNRTPQKRPNIEDVTLDELLSRSDVICITCPLNAQTKGMINKKNVNILKPNVIITGSTQGVFDEDVLQSALCSGNIQGAAFNMRKDGSKGINNYELINHPHFLHTASDIDYTKEEEERRINICIDNIEAYTRGEEKNILN